MGRFPGGVLALVGGLGMLASSALADSVVSITSGFTQIKLANDGYPSDFDILTFAPTTTTFDLSLNQPVTVAINSWEYDVGYSSYEVFTTTTDITRTMTLTWDGIPAYENPQDITQSFTAYSTYVGDHVEISQPDPMLFSFDDGAEIMVQVLGFDLPNADGVWIGSYYSGVDGPPAEATFTLLAAPGASPAAAPLPAAAWAGLSLLGGLGLVAKWRRRKNPTV